MCMCHCDDVCLCDLMTEPCDVIRTRNFTWKSALAMSRSNAMGRVKGQGHKIKKPDFQALGIEFPYTATMAYSVTYMRVYNISQQ